MAAGLMILIAAAAALTGCGKVSQGYTVEGGDDERSLVTDESFAAMYATMACAQDEEMDGSWTEYEGSSYAAEGAAEVAPEEEEGRKWRTILEDVSLFSSPENGRVLIVVPKGSKVDVLTKKQDGWYQIRYRGTTGYVKSGYFVEDWEAERAERIAREGLRKRPGRRPRKRLRRRRKRKQERRPRKRPGRRRKKRPKRRLRKRLQGSPRRKRQKKRGKPKKPLRPLKKPDSKLKKRPGRKLKRKRQERLRKKRGLRREPGQWPPER